MVIFAGTADPLIPYGGGPIGPLGRVVSRRDGADTGRGLALVEAVDWNRRLWRTLAADCMDDRNALTQDVRAKIISLSLWVAKYSRSVTREKASLDPLIEINRTIMQGLHAG